MDRNVVVAGRSSNRTLITRWTSQGWPVKSYGVAGPHPPRVAVASSHWYRTGTVFYVPGPALPPPTHWIDGIIDFVIAENGPGGHLLERLSPHSGFRVASSKLPEKVVNDFMSYCNNFVELGHLDIVYDTPADSPHNNRPLTNTLTLAPAVAITVGTTINGYLATHYGACQEQMNTLMNMLGYQSAYRHCLMEHQIICQIMAAEVEFQGMSISICPDDIASWMGVSPGTFATCRTEVIAAHAAHLLLCHLEQQETQGPMEPCHYALLATLSSMSSRILSPIDTSSGYAGVANLQAGDANAVCMKIATFKHQVAEVKALWGSQFR
ncbi:hypothetical protein B0H10DRAFT_1940585 [Mycena sp. CBHHK59/15]|nr:hypothetical protein B0H10DRAFT_1940585 [Mycena sp. CBHHK59/15]